MINKWLIGLIISFILKQLDRLAHTIDWEMLKSELDAQIAAAVPFKWLVPELVAFTNHVIDVLAVALAKQDDLQKILDLLAAGKWSEAAIALRDLIIGGWGAVAPEHVDLHAELCMVS